MEARIQQHLDAATVCEGNDDPVGAQAARQKAEKWSQKADVARTQLQDVSEVLQRQKASLKSCEREAPSLLRSEEQQGVDSFLCMTAGSISAL